MASYAFLEPGHVFVAIGLFLCHGLRSIQFTALNTLAFADIRFAYEPRLDVR